MSDQNKRITMGTVNPRNVNFHTNPRPNYQIPQREYRTPYYEQQNYTGTNAPGNFPNLAPNVAQNFNVPPPNFTHNSQNVPVVQSVQQLGQNFENNSRQSQLNQNRQNYSQNPNNKPRTPCKFCKEWHFHSQCPQNPFRRREGDPQPPPETNINRTQVPKN